MCVCLAGECLSSNQPAVQISDEVDKEAGLAVDDDPLTFSCTVDDEAFPWWVVDLGAEYEVGSIGVTLPSINGDNRKYRRSCFNHYFTNSLTDSDNNVDSLLTCMNTLSNINYNNCKQCFTGYVQGGPNLAILYLLAILLVTVKRINKIQQLSVHVNYK